MKNLRSIIQLAFLACAVLAQAQSNSHVSINVVAEDKLGHPVRGLQNQEFTLLDNGQPRAIDSFREVDERVAADPTRIVIVVDMMNIDLGAVARVREQLGEFLNQDGGKLSHPTAIGVMAESGIKMMQGTTTDGHALEDAFKKFQTEIRSVGRDAGFYGAAERMQKSLGELGEVAAYEATQPGRKLVLVISPGWALFSGAGVEEDTKQRTLVYNSIAQISNGLREAHVALYSLNPFDLGRTNPFFYQGYLKGVSKVSQAEYPYLSLQVLAEHSGGRALTSGRDILGELNTAVRDAGTYYQLSFEAAPADPPSEYHELRVKTDKPDLTIRTNASYYTQTGAAAANPSGPTK